MSTNPQPDPGRRRAEPSPRAAGRLSVTHLVAQLKRVRLSRQNLLVAGMAAALVACLAFTVARPDVTSTVASDASTVQGAPSRPPAVIVPQPGQKGAVTTPGSSEPGPNTISAMRQQISKAQAQASRQARIVNSKLDVRVAYFNMLGCYHTDHNEPHYGFLAFNFAPCTSRMPRQYAYLDEHGVTIAGVSEFQGKAYSVLRSINGGVWGMFPTHQSGANGQNLVVWRNSDWSLLRGEEIPIPYNTCGHCRGRGTASMVLLQHRKTGRKIWVLNTHHTSNGGGFGAGRRAEATAIELNRLRASAGDIPVLYMGDFNESGPVYGRLSGILQPAFSGMGIDQIWGSLSLEFSNGGYDGSFRSRGLTDHGDGIAITQVTLAGQP